jgi:polar amino acid transport system substrate-binding protein
LALADDNWHDQNHQNKGCRVKKIMSFALSCMVTMVGISASAARAEDIIKVALVQDLEPFVVNDGSRYDGVYPRLMKELAKHANMRAEFSECPVKRCEVWLQNGQTDLVIGLRDTPQRKEYVRFLSVPHRVGSTRVFYLRKGEGKKIKRYEDLYSNKIGVLLGSKYFEPFDSDSKILKEEVAREESNIQKLLRGRIDAFVIPEDRGEYYLSKLNVRDKVERAPYAFKDSLPRYIGISTKSPLLGKYELFNKALKDLIDSGTLDRLYDEYYFNKFNIPRGLFSIRVR